MHRTRAVLSMLKAAGNRGVDVDAFPRHGIHEHKMHVRLLQQLGHNVRPFTERSVRGPVRRAVVLLPN